MRIIAVVNQKGGVGKTTTAVNLGAALALRGRRVLLIDMDPQGNLTDHVLGGTETAEGAERPSIYDVLVEGLPLERAVAPTFTPGLFGVPSHEDLAGAELDLASVIGRELLLRDALAELPPTAYDFVLLDCPPSLGLLSLNALAAAHEVFIALQTEFFAMRGLGALDKTIDLVKRRINPSLVVGGIVPTLVDLTRLAREVTDEVKSHYGDLVFATRIRTNIRLAEAPSHGKHIFDYAPDSPGAHDYASLALEVEEGRAAVEAAGDALVGVPVDSPGKAPSREPAGRKAPPPSAPRVPGPPPRRPTASPPHESERPATAAASPATAPLPAPAPVPAPAPALPSSPPTPKRPSMTLPVLRDGPRSVAAPPLPTRPPSSVPRPESLRGARPS